ncbi:MAG: hypothetical protein ABJC63_12330 [Gemmatimonadales bacterium]
MRLGRESPSAHLFYDSIGQVEPHQDHLLDVDYRCAIAERSGDTKTADAGLEGRA